MLISTRGRYALRLLVDLAENQDEGFVTSHEIAERQEISVKYAERIMAALSRGKIVSTQTGKGGGYRLERNPKDCRLSEILKTMNEEIAPVACLKLKPNSCPRAGKCPTLPVWEKLEGIINNFFDEITLADLLK